MLLCLDGWTVKVSADVKWTQLKHSVLPACVLSSVMPLNRAVTTRLAHSLNYFHAEKRHEEAGEEAQSSECPRKEQDGRNNLKIHNSMNPWDTLWTNVKKWFNATNAALWYKHTFVTSELSSAGRERIIIHISTHDMIFFMSEHCVRFIDKNMQAEEGLLTNTVLTHFFYFTA